MRATLTASRRPLATSFDVALLDLDGVVYVGRDAVPGAPQALAQAREAGMRLAFVTNNAARPPASVAEHLRSLSIPADPEEVITSSQAAAHYLADRLPSQAKVLVVGTTGLIEALRERGLEPVFSADDRPAAVVQGYSPELDWKQLAEGAVAIRAGALWVATNLDPTVPSPRGPLPGNGSMVAALRHATGVTPVATGKPDPTMHRESVQRSGAKTPIVVGDRLDTDVEGAVAVGCRSLLVLSGVTTVPDLLAASPEHRPDYLAPTVAGLLSAHPPVAVDGNQARCGRWLAAADDTVLTLSQHRDTDEPDSADDLDPLRALCTAAWTAAGEQGGTAWQVRAAGEDAQGVLQAFALS
jgi:HAD superfamily hydrolase (TIGR01450 family)